MEPLENQPIKGSYKILVVGTFNGDMLGNHAPWFYGRPENEFWCLFPRMLGFPTLHPVDRDEPIEDLSQLWMDFCRNNRIEIVDLFKSVEIDLPNHADKNLEKLVEGEFTAFDFQRAFEHCHFEKVVFTWKGIQPNRLTSLKQAYINFFEPKGSRIIHLLTPSLAYSKPRNFKLNQWKGAFYE